MTSAWAWYEMVGVALSSFATDEGLAAAERHAQEQKLGIWKASKSPTPPWVFRASPQACSDPPAVTEGLRFRGNTRSKVYHALAVDTITA